MLKHKYGYILVDKDTRERVYFSSGKRLRHSYCTPVGLKKAMKAANYTPINAVIVELETKLTGIEIEAEYNG